jgi:tetratricopeptide (TPR) repeat protein
MLLPLLMLVSGTAEPPWQASVQAGSEALAKGDVDGARTILEQATRTEPRNARAWLLLAQTYANQKNKAAALAAAAKAESLAPHDPYILQGLANFYAVSVPDLPKAAGFGARYAQTAPEDRTAWKRLAAFCVQANLPDAAIAAGLKALPNDNSAELHSILGQAYVERKEWPNATRHLSEAVKLNPYDEGTHFRLAQSYLLQQDFPDAARVLEAARKTFDKSAQIELALGVAYYGQRKFSEAVDQFLKTIRLAPDVPQPYLFLSRILEHAGDRLPEVTRRFAELETKNPKSPLGYLLHAKALVAQLPPTGYPAEAQTAYALVQKSLSIKEDQADAHYIAGLLLERQREFEQAARHLERSVALNPNDAAAHFRLARVYDRLGRREEADKQRALHEKLSEEAKSGGGGEINIGSPGVPAK